MKYCVKHKILIILSIFLLCFTIGFIISYKNSHELEIVVDYDMSLIIDDVNVTFYNDNEEVPTANFDIINIDNSLGKTVVRLKATKSGQTNIRVNCVFKDNNISSYKTISQYARVNNYNMIFTSDKITSYISFRYLFYAFSVMLGILSIFSLFNFIYNLKKNTYTQKTILNGASFIFLGILFLIYSIGIVYTILNYSIVDIKVLSFITSNVMALSIIISIPFLIIYAIILSICNIKLFYKEGIKLRNSLGLIFSGAMFLGLCIMAILLYLNNFVYIDNLFISIIYSIAGALYVLFESMLFSSIICSIYVTRKHIDLPVDYIIIPGCRISSDGKLLPLIKGRVDKAIDLYNKQLKEFNKKLVFVPSGGKGNDEVISEGEAMMKYLYSQGISKEQIIVENKAVSTYENFSFSKELIDKKDNSSNKNIIFSTTNYHIFRSGIIANQLGLDIKGIGSKTKWHFWPNAFVHEIVAIFVNQRKKQIIILTLLSILAGLSAVIYSLI